MIVVIVIRNLSARVRLREQIESLSLGLEKHFRSVQRVEWDLVPKDRAVLAHCRVHARSGFYRASAHASRGAEALDQVFEKIIKQRRRKKRQQLTGRRQTPA